MTSIYIPAHVAPQSCDEPALWFAFRKSELALCTTHDGHALPRCKDLAEHGLEGLRPQYIGRYDGQHCYAVELGGSTPLPEGWRLVGLRDAFGALDSGLGVLSGRAFQILEWDLNHRYCGQCGSPTNVRADERARVCPGCRRTTYPPVSPAIMVLICDGRRVLLARKATSPPGRYSALAGFVEPGEMLEDTVARETFEEVGVQVKNIRYFGSQPWPFPHSLMIAFTADYAGGEVRPDGVEIEEARWFDVDEMPHLPASISISRRLIDTITAELATRHA